MDSIKLEICSFSFADCYNAKNGGADRVELCSSPQEAGTTPSYGLVKKVKESIDIQVYPMIRPRGGDFVYTADEFEVMLHDIRTFKALECNGIAVGALTNDGTVDTEKMKNIIDVAWPMGVTFIRCFDLVPDAFQALEALIACGCERVLTSGQASVVTDGLPLVKQLVNFSNNKISIMAGSGVRYSNVEDIVKETGVKEIHTSARMDNTYIQTEKFDFGRKFTNDQDQIIQIRQILNRLSWFN